MFKSFCIDKYNKLKYKLIKQNNNFVITKATRN